MDRDGGWVVEVGLLGMEMDGFISLIWKMVWFEQVGTGLFLYTPSPVFLQ